MIFFLNLFRHLKVIKTHGGAQSYEFKAEALLAVLLGATLQLKTEPTAAVLTLQNSNVLFLEVLEKLQFVLETKICTERFCIWRKTSAGKHKYG